MSKKPRVTKAAARSLQPKKGVRAAYATRRAPVYVRCTTSALGRDDTGWGALAPPTCHPGDSCPHELQSSEMRPLSKWSSESCPCRPHIRWRNLSVTRESSPSSVVMVVIFLASHYFKTDARAGGSADKRKSFNELPAFDETSGGEGNGMGQGVQSSSHLGCPDAKRRFVSWLGGNPATHTPVAAAGRKGVA